jgi:hypothetical protein
VIVDWEREVVEGDPLFLDLAHAAYTSAACTLQNLAIPAFKVISKRESADPLARLFYDVLGDLHAHDGMTVWLLHQCAQVAESLGEATGSFRSLFDTCRSVGDSPTQ